MLPFALINDYYTDAADMQI